MTIPNAIVLDSCPFETIQTTSTAFDRNDRYRRTIQTQYGCQTMPTARQPFANSRGSVTPTPQRSQPLSHGHSQTSLNPFDADDGDEYLYRGYSALRSATNGANTDDNVSRATVNVVLADGAGGVRKVYRKKRRAPPPPPPRTSSVPTDHRGVPDGNVSVVCFCDCSCWRLDCPGAPFKFKTICILLFGIAANTTNGVQNSAQKQLAPTSQTDKRARCSVDCRRNWKLSKFLRRIRKYIFCIFINTAVSI